MRAKSTAAGIAATLAAAVVWGSSFSVNDLGLAHVGPGAFSFLRFALAAPVMFAALWLLSRRYAAPPAGPAGRAILRSGWFWGLCAANASAYLLQYVAQTMTTPARTALFVNTSAFAVALLERALFGMRLGWKRVVAILLGFCGAGILIVGPDPMALVRGGVGRAVVGDALALLAGLTWSLYFVHNDRAVERVDPVRLTAWTFAGTATLLVVAPLLDPWLSGAPAQGLSAPGAAAILYSAVVTTALAFGLFTYGLTRIRASVSAVLLLVEILVASLVSLALGRESFGTTDLVGAGLLVGALVVASYVAQTDAARGVT